MASGLSKYADKLAARRRESNGRLFQPLTDNGIPTPIPRPLLGNYFPSHETQQKGSNEDNSKLFDHEYKNRAQISRFKTTYKGD